MDLRSITSHMLEEDPFVCVIETLHNECTGYFLRQGIINLKLVTKLLSCDILGV